MYDTSVDATTEEEDDDAEVERLTLAKEKVQFESIYGTLFDVHCFTVVLRTNTNSQFTNQSLVSVSCISLALYDRNHRKHDRKHDRKHPKYL